MLTEWFAVVDALVVWLVAASKLPEFTALLTAVSTALGKTPTGSQSNPTAQETASAVVAPPRIGD